MNTGERPLQDLFDASNRHRAEHGADCNVYPSPDAMLWGSIAAALPASRVLEIGCGIGYLAACVAAISPSCCVETIEKDSTHIRLAEDQFVRRGYKSRITILKGDAEKVLSGLETPYDMVIEDANLEYPRWLPELTRLTRPGGVLITRNLAGRSLDWDQFLPTNATTLVRARPTG